LSVAKTINYISACANKHLQHLVFLHTKKSGLATTASFVLTYGPFYMSPATIFFLSVFSISLVSTIPAGHLQVTCSVSISNSSLLNQLFMTLAGGPLAI